MARIVAIGTAVPDYGTTQKDIFEFMAAVYDGTADDKRKLKLLYERTGISRRYSVVPDYDTSLGERKLYSGTHDLEPFPGLEKRMELYDQHAAQLGAKAVDDLGIDLSTNAPTHLITVSCTGMSAPGLDLALMKLLNLPNDTERTSVNFMGCYAGVHAFKQATAICNNMPDARVLIVSVELCTLHFQKDHSYDNLTANALFADGAAACLVAGDGYKDEHERTQLMIRSFHSEVHDSGEKDMSWQLSATGFLMTLSAYIPQLIGFNIEQLVTKALAKSGLSANEIGIWAIHPGGRKILEAVQQKLELEKEALAHSYAVLNEYGNMSSATILFVLKRILEDETQQGNIFGAAFGPGLTLETFIFTKVQH